MSTSSRFLRRFLDALPGDPLSTPTPRVVQGALWSRVQPTPVRAPRLLAWSQPLARELGLDEEQMNAPATAEVLGGAALWEGMEPYAANYGGYQFGHWAGQLGDGRAIVLGEWVGPDGRVHELQLKGAGRTAYSRRGDGRAVLRSSIREFLCSEAMHALGVPTTRALALVATGEEVLRDFFYDGNAQLEPGAIVCRVAPSFLRFGSFELPSARGDIALLRQLADFALTHYFAHLGAPGRAATEAMLHEVASSTATLMAQWQALGFVHGVMNTDNFSLLGLTIDYGPYGWIDDFDLDWTPNTTDAEQRRYAFGQQPAVGLWNLARFGQALLPLFDGEEGVVEGALERYREVYAATASELYGRKLGLRFDAQRGDDELVQSVFDLLSAAPTDMTLFFRALSAVARAETLPTSLPSGVQASFYGEVPPPKQVALLRWLQRWWRRVRSEPGAPEELAARMDRINPRYVLRNWLAQEAIDAAHAGDLSKVERLLRVLERPFDAQPEHAELAAKRPEWARRKAGCSMLSCSS